MEKQGKPIPAHPDTKTELKMRMNRNHGDFDLAFKDWREDTHPAFHGGFGATNKDDHID